MKIAYYIECLSGHYPHIIALLERHPGIIVTPNVQTYTFLIKKYNTILWKKSISSFIEEYEISTLITPAYYNLSSSSNIQRIQIFHGVSDKHQYYLSHKPDSFDVFIFQSPILLKMYQSKYPNTRYSYDISNHTKASLYGKDLSIDNDYVVYTPTWKNISKEDSLSRIDEVLALPHPLVIKFHPNTYSDSEFIATIRKKLKQNQKIIEPHSYEDVNFHETLKRSSLLISDFSSMIYEYTLTKKNIIVLSSGVQPKSQCEDPLFNTFATTVLPGEDLNLSVEKLYNTTYEYDESLFGALPIEEVITKWLR